jgi:type IV pilus assembly protein PilM
MISSGKKIGVDAGSSLVKIIEISKSGDGVGVANWSFMPFRLPADAPPEAISQVQAQAIDAAIKKCDCKCRDIVVGIPGNSAFIRNIKLPPVPASKIDQIVRYEIQQTIPFPIENIALDYQVLEPDETSEIEVIMVAMKGEMAEDFITDVEKAKVRVGVVDSIPLALYNCYRYNEYSSKEECTAIMELGASSSNILIELNGELRYCRSVGIGGNDITAAIAKEMGLPFQQAERIKTQHGIIFPESQAENFNEDIVRVSRAISGVLERLLGEVKLTIGYFRSLTGATAISRAVLAGGTAMLKNVRPFLADRLGVQVEILNPFKKVAVPKNLVNVRKAAPMFATAVGLALRSAGDCCQLKISLIPPKLKEAKSRRVKMLCHAASAVLAALIIGFYAVTSIEPPEEKEALLANIEKEIERYAEHEPTLLDLQSKIDLLKTEYELYSKYPNEYAVDIVTPLVVLAETVEGDVWIKSLDYPNKASLSIAGAIESKEQRVEGMRQLSELRTKLETYCGEKKIIVAKQENTKDGLSFDLKANEMPTLEEFLEIRAAEREKAAMEKAEKEQAEEAQEQEEDASEQSSETNETEETEDDEA